MKRYPPSIGGYLFIWHEKHLAKELDANRNKKEEKNRPIFLIWLYQK